MNISPINNNQSNTNFGALKSIEFGKKFKGNPKLQNQLLDAFEKSEAMQKFCKKFDVDILFDTANVIGGQMLAMMHVAYATRPTSKLNFMDKLMGQGPFTSGFYVDAEDYVSSLEETTNSLCEKMAESDKKFEEKIKRLEAQPKRLAEQDAFELAQKEEIMKEKEQREVEKRILTILNNQ